MLAKTEHKNDIVILKGSGKFFCVGGDLKELPYLSAAETSTVKTFLYEIYDMIANFSKPYVALIDGLSVGGGAVYSMPAIYRIVTEKTVMFMPETTIGYFNDVGSTHFLSQLDNNFGIYMGMTGIKVKGFDIKKVGLATHYVQSDKLDELEKRLMICKTHDDVTKTLSLFSSDKEFHPSELDHILPQINKCFSGSTVEEIFESLESDGSDWAKETLNILNKNSPISLKVTHRTITTAKNLSFRNGLKMELRVAVNFVGTSDFKEGVRAVLIDKDFKPKWSKKSIYDVTDEDVEKFFKMIPAPYELKFKERIRNKL